MRRHQDAAYRLALRMVGLAAAEDLAQQGFMKAWTALDRFEGKSTFSTWLYRIVANLCFDYLRRIHRFQPTPLDEAVLPNGEDVAAYVETVVDQAARREALAWALDRLPTEIA